MPRPKRVLVVDDDVDFADSLEELLAVDGIEVDLTHDGAAAIAALERRHFDVILLDVRMPGIDGLTCLLELRRIDPAARILVMTAYSQPALLDAALADGATAVLCKPLDFDWLRSVIDEMHCLPLVLLADDDADFVDSLRATLVAEGYAVRAAGDGDALLVLARAHPLDVLLLDLRMPGVDGLQACEELDRLGLQPPTVVISAYLDEERQRLSRLRSLDPRHVLCKPLDVPRLVGLLEQLLTSGDRAWSS